MSSNQVVERLSSSFHFLEFGVHDGTSLNRFCKILDEDIRIAGFDSFRGLRNAWSKPDKSIGSMSLEGIPPKEISDRAEIVIGWVEETLPVFLKNNSDLEALVVHLDLDVFEPTAFVLKNLTPHIGANTLIVFDDYFGFLGWENHSSKAKEQAGLSLELVAFSLDGAAVFQKSKEV